MAKVIGQGPSQRIERESEALIRLGMLLRRERSQQGNSEVQSILAQEISTWEKVRLIRSLDQRERRARSEHASRVSTHPHRYFGTVKPRKSRKQIRTAAKRPPRVKSTLYREGYFAFLFHHLRRVRSFGQATKTLSPVLFPPSVRVSENLPGFYVGYVQPVARDIYVTLSQMMSNAWVHLTKRQYNLLVLVLELCNAIQSNVVVRAHLHESRAIDCLKGVEQNLLAIRYNDDSVPMILEAISTLRARNRRIISGIDSLYELVRGLISRDENPPSLIDCIIALNMLKYRRHIAESELTISGLGQIVETGVFDCPAETQEYIDEFIENTEQQLEALRQEELELLAIRNYVHTNDSGNVDMEPLSRLVKNYLSEGWDHACRHPVVLCEAVAEGFLERFRRLLCGRIHIASIGKTRLFADKPFDDDFVRIERALTTIRESSFHLRGMQRDRLAKLHNHSHHPTHFEADFLMQLRILVEIIESVRQRVMALLRYEATPEAQFEPLDSRTSSDMMRGLPLDARVLANASSSEGPSLRGLLEEVVRVSYLVSYSFGDKRINHLLKREHELQRERDALLEKVHRIADRDVAERLHSLFAR